MTTTVKFIADYQVLGIIGDGGQANVYLCSRDSSLYAVKVFNSTSHKNQAFQRETKFLSVINHPNLIKMFATNSEAVIKYADRMEYKRSAIVLQFAKNGDLFQYISITKAFKPQFCRAIFKNLLSGIDYLNQFGISHRDLKPQNVLFNDQFQLKITDFGLSTFSQGAQKDYILHTKVGTQGFKAPQVDNGQYNGLKADLFAIGVILFCLYTGSPPFLTTKPSDKIYRYITNKNFQKFWSIHQKSRSKSFFSPNFKKLINSLLVFNPEQRPSIEQIKQSQWLNEQTATQQQLKIELSIRSKTIFEESEQKRNLLKLFNKNYESESIKQIQQSAQTSINQQSSIFFEQNNQRIEDIKTQV